MKYEDEFENLLSEALSDVREAEPRVGLEGRVLAGVRARSEERRFAWWRWVAVAAMVMLIVLGIAVRRGAKNDVVVKSPVKVEATRAVESAKGTSPAPVVKEAEKGRAAARAVRKRVSEPAVKPEEVPKQKAPFPTPAPMTEQEKALMLLARNNPEVLVGLGKEQRVERREIAPIKFEPITIGGSGEKEQ